MKQALFSLLHISSIVQPPSLLWNSINFFLQIESLCQYLALGWEVLFSFQVLGFPEKRFFKTSHNLSVKSYMNLAIRSECSLVFSVRA